VTVLPSTDLFLTGRDHDHNIPRGVTHAHRLTAHGVTCSLATNNVLNPFTPFGDCSLIRIANLYANVAQLGDAPSLCSCLGMVTSGPAKLMNVRDYGIEVSHPADLVVLDCREEAAAVAEIVQPLFALKRGRRSFTRPLPTLHQPQHATASISSPREPMRVELPSITVPLLFDSRPPATGNSV
jgi:cytosine deaminase